MPHSVIAIIGLSCRFPQCSSPDDYWQLLREGHDGITEIPGDRWDKDLFFHPDKNVPGKSYTFSAGTLGDVSGFDASFFGISPREAEEMDPQQRLLLELAWEALESGGQVPSHLRGRNCAVYVGISATDYADIRQGDPSSGEAYFMLGSTLSIAANRLSYVFDLKGPSMALDTACSSSLVALNEALNALWSERAEMAVVGGVHLLLSPLPFIGFSKASMLSDYGRCQAFSKIAQGYVRGEGAGVLVLKPLDAALRDGDQIDAVITGSGVNSDGKTNGIAMPSCKSQQSLLESTMAKFAIDPAHIDFFEAHGTGTSVGDPVEALAIGQAVGQKRSDAAGPLPIGSAKSNIGHLEPASGMAGLIKTVLALKHRAVPKSLHCEELNPNIDFEGVNIAPVREHFKFPPMDRPLNAAVNSFGFGGTNAVVFLREYQQPEVILTEKSISVETPPLFLSARSDKALRAMASQMVELLCSEDAPDYYDVAYSSIFHRELHNCRVVIKGDDVAAIFSSLTAFAKGVEGNFVTGTSVVSDGKVGFVFSGNGSQWAGMGRVLYRENTLFRDTVDDIDCQIIERAGWSIVQVLMAEDCEEQLRRTEVAQPALFALQIAICACLQDLGILPDAVMGHSVGEVAAAHISGILSLDEAVRLILCRSEIQGRTRGMGKMAAAELPVDEAEALIERFDNRFEIAAINGPNSVSLSGDEDALRSAQDAVKADGKLFKVLDLEYAFHSQVLDPVRDAFFDTIGAVETSAGDLPYISTVSGSVLEGDALNSDYWWRNVRERVQFKSALEAMVDHGCAIFIEIGPHAILQSYINQILRKTNTDGAVVATLNKKDDTAHRLDDAVDQAFIAGVRRDLTHWFPTPGRFVTLPTYPWQKERYWFATSPEAQGPMYRHTEGVFLGVRPLAGVTIWESQIDVGRFPFLADHQVGSNIVFPATGYLEIALEASRALFEVNCHEIEAFEIRRPLIIDAGTATMVRFVYDAQDKAFRLESRKRMSGDRWTLNAVGRLSEVSFASDRVPQLPSSLPDSVAVSAVDHYAVTEALGITYGPAFQGVIQSAVAGDQALAELAKHAGEYDFVVNPTTFDAALQVLFDIMATDAATTERTAFLPYQLGRLKVFASGQSANRCHVVLRKRGERSLVADFRLFAEDGSCLVEAQGFRFMRADSLRRSRASDVGYCFDWTPKDYVGPADVPPTAEDIAALLDGGHVTNGPDLNALADAFVSKAASAQDVWRRAYFKNPDSLAELLCIGAAGERLKSETAEPVMPSHALQDHLLQGSPCFASAGRTLLEALELAVAAWPEGRRVRILEIGAKAPVAPAFLAELGRLDVDYTLISADEDALSHLEMELATAPNAQFLPIDVGGILTDVELAALGRFDIVVKPLACFEARLTPSTRENLKLLLVPQGLMLVSDAKPNAWLDLVFGGHPGWSTAEGGSRLETPQTVAEAFTSDGFAEPRLIEFDSTYVMLIDGPQADAHYAPAPTALGAGETWVLVAPRDGDGARTANAAAVGFEAHGKSAVLVFDDATAAKGADEDDLSLDTRDDAPWAELFDVFSDMGAVPEGIVLFLDPADDGWRALTAARVLAKSGLNPLPRLYLVTTNAKIVDGVGTADVAAAKSALAWGAARVIRNELPMCSCRVLDIHMDALASADIGQRLSETILLNDDEDELVVTGDGCYAPRLRPVPLPSLGTGQPQGSRLSFTAGKLDAMQWDGFEIPEPKSDEIVVENKATGLNFRDVMFALGVLPGEALENGFSGPTIGLEAAGTVVAVGVDVDDFSVGDDVLCYAPSCFSTHIVTKTTAVAHKPDTLTFAQAATIPTVFLTVYYALHHLARLEAGERVLIHGAAGGVGLAAIQYAQHVGAEIYVTAGSDEKRTLLGLLGVAGERILDSRSLRFADDILALTDGEGMDVILNSLAGEAIHRNLDILRPFGRLLELGKRDFYENSRIGLKYFRNNLTYFGIDADQLLVERSDLARRLFMETMVLFERGVFTPLPYRTFEAVRVSEAFRYMQQSKHIGKIIVTPPDFDLEEEAQENFKEPLVKADAAYVVTGGLAGFGFENARWLAEKGAGALILISRSGLETEAARVNVEKLESMGTKVIAAACDVTDASAVGALIKQAEAAGFSLNGIIHAAAVFEDSLIDTLTFETYQKVLAPKVDGCAVLHQLSEGKELDFFVLHSSITTAFGNPGQANYVAANHYLEAFSDHRRALGLPSLSIGWGAIADAGYLARNTDIRDNLERKLGSDALTSRRALEVLEQLLVTNASGFYVAGVDWRQLRAGLPALRSSIYQDVLRGVGDETSQADSEDIIRKILDMDEVESLGFIGNILAEEIGKVLRLAADRVDRSKSVFDLGMDSLMAVELSLAVEDRVGIEIPPMMLSDGGSVASLSVSIRSRLIDGGEGASAASNAKRLIGKHMDEDEQKKFVNLGDLNFSSDQEVHKMPTVEMAQ
jgi:phthiocerol/phenolphthiocerol synthesis type-I polyketide synthase C